MTTLPHMEGRTPAPPPAPLPACRRRRCRPQGRHPHRPAQPGRRAELEVRGRVRGARRRLRLHGGALHRWAGGTEAAAAAGCCAWRRPLAAPCTGRLADSFGMVSPGCGCKLSGAHVCRLPLTPAAGVCAGLDDTGATTPALLEADQGDSISGKVSRAEAADMVRGSSLQQLGRHQAAPACMSTASDPSGVIPQPPAMLPAAHETHAPAALACSLCLPASCLLIFLDPRPLPPRVSVHRWPTPCPAPRR
jgi:hypothetical protein